MAHGIKRYRLTLEKETAKLGPAAVSPMVESKGMKIAVSSGPLRSLIIRKEPEATPRSSG